jgi:(R)-2-hydroxyacyl-CoA dehydratese activating ATPase
MITAGIDVGSTYTKVVLLNEKSEIVASAMINTGFRMESAAAEALERALSHAGLTRDDVAYLISTGQGRYQVPWRDLQVTDLTAQARGTRYFFPRTHTVLDVGGQTMKASRLDDRGRVASFRLNDKCAAGTGAFLEKAARYLGFATEQIGALAASSGSAASISGVCAVFAESEVINHVSQGVAPADIMHGAMVSLTTRAVQLMKRVKVEPEVTLVGGIMRFPTMPIVLAEQLKMPVNVPPNEMAQMTAAVGAAVLAQQRLAKRDAAA